MSKINELIKELCPNGIEYKKIGDISKYRRGSFPQPYTENKFYGGEGAMPFVQVADVREDMKLVDQTSKTISKIAQPKSVFVPKNTVIVTLQGTIGRVAITQYDSYIDRTIAIFEGLDNTVLPKYFAYQIQKKFSIEKENARGSTIKTITKEEMTEFEIPVPPIEVQKEIVSILDQFMELQFKLESNLELRKKQFNFYKNKILEMEVSND